MVSFLERSQPCIRIRYVHSAMKETNQAGGMREAAGKVDGGGKAA